MIYLICAIYDRKIEAFQPPFYVKHAGLAERFFAMQILEPKNGEIATFPQDYALYHIGHWNDEKGIFMPLEKGHVLITTGAELSKKLSD